MNITTQGHTYELDHRENTGEHQTVHFVQKVPVEPGSTELRLIQDGTTNEEVLRMMINRYQFLQIVLPCRENAIVLTKLEECLMWTEKRTNERRERNVQGTNIK